VISKNHQFKKEETEQAKAQTDIMKLELLHRTLVLVSKEAHLLEEKPLSSIKLWPQVAIKVQSFNRHKDSSKMKTSLNFLLQVNKLELNNLFHHKHQINLTSLNINNNKIYKHRKLQRPNSQSSSNLTNRSPLLLTIRNREKSFLTSSQTLKLRSQKSKWNHRLHK
jgi:hypothetical protein